jgi:hypothetical protein
MQVSSPESGEVAATSRKYRDSILIGADGVVPKPNRVKDRFPKRFRIGTTPLRLIRKWFLFAYRRNCPS